MAPFLTLLLQFFGSVPGLYLNEAINFPSKHLFANYLLLTPSIVDFKSGSLLCVCSHFLLAHHTDSNPAHVSSVTEHGDFFFKLKKKFLPNLYWLHTFSSSTYMNITPIATH